MSNPASGLSHKPLPPVSHPTPVALTEWLRRRALAFWRGLEAVGQRRAAIVLARYAAAHPELARTTDKGL